MSAAPTPGARGVYAGERTIDGVAVSFDGEPLVRLLGWPPEAELDFEWGYEGESPTRLAHALLLHHGRDDALARRLEEPLMARLVARLSNEWEVEATELERLVGELQAASAATA